MRVKLYNTRFLHSGAQLVQVVEKTPTKSMFICIVMTGPLSLVPYLLNMHMFYFDNNWLNFIFSVKIYCNIPIVII